MAYIVPKNKGGLGTTSLIDCLTELDTAYTIAQPIDNSFINSLPTVDTIQDGSYITVADVDIQDGTPGLLIKTPTNDAFGYDIRLISGGSRVIRTDIFKVKLNGSGSIESKEPASKLNYNPIGRVKPITENRYFVPVYNIDENTLKSMLNDAIASGLKVLPQFIIERVY